MYSQLIASRTPVLLISISTSYERTHPSKAETPRTSKLAILSSTAPSSSHPSALGSSAFPFPFLSTFPSPSPSSGSIAASNAARLRSGWALLHASKDSRISETDRELGESCLFASNSNGRLRSRGEFSTSSKRFSRAPIRS